jgi:urease accessory protein
MKTGRRSDEHSMLCAVATIVSILLPSAAAAHVGQGDVGGGFLAGVLHPISGLDHVVAMVAVGIWGAQLGAPAIWVLPVTFPLVMASGGVLGALGVPIPGVEIGIALSAIALGLMVTLSLRLPLWVAGAMVAVFAICHGYAHGAELPESANAIAYALGFVFATGSLHVLGIVLGVARRWPAGATALRLCGVAIVGCGVYFLLPHLAAG